MKELDIRINLGSSTVLCVLAIVGAAMYIFKKQEV